MPKGSRNGKAASGKRTEPPRPMNKPAMMDWALRLLRLLNERKVLNSRIVAEEFDVNNDMDFREHIARWMPFFRVLEPARYREFIRGIATQVATRNEGLPI